MRLATVRTEDGLRAARIEGDGLVLMPFHDVGEALASAADGSVVLNEVEGEWLPLAGAGLAPVIPRPEKIFGVGLNYAAHAEEAKMAVPQHPPLFAKFWRSLVGPYDNILLPPNSECVDWEVELAVVIGKHARYLDEDEALGAIAGYSIMNDISMRDWQLRTSEFLQGKTFESSAPLGPWLVSLDELDDPGRLQLVCEVDNVRRQEASTADMVVSPPALVAYISQFITLVPGDVIATGTPGGVGGAMDPPHFLSSGQTVRTAIAGIGELVNQCVAE
jgi:acylpyruvate hydrolase